MTAKRALGGVMIAVACLGFTGGVAAVIGCSLRDFLMAWAMSLGVAAWITCGVYMVLE